MSKALHRSGGLSAFDSNAVLTEFRQRAVADVEKLVEGFLDTLLDYLLDRAAQSGGQSHNPHYDGLHRAKRLRPAIQRSSSRFLLNLPHQNDPVAGDWSMQQGAAAEQEELGLVDVQDFEDRLAMENLVSSADQLYSGQLECLALRYAELTRSNPLNVRLPLHIREIGRSLEHPLMDDEVLHSIAPEIFRVFGDHVLPQLGATYDELNAWLRGLGVRPELEGTLETQGSLLEPLRRAPRQLANRPTSAQPEQADAASGQPPQEPAPFGAATTQAAPAVEARYASLQQALAQANGLNAAPGSAAGTPAHPLSALPDDTVSSLMQALDALQVAAPDDKPWCPQTPLSSTLNSVLPDKDDDEATAAGLQRIDLVDQLLSSIRNGLESSAPLHNTLGDLRLPLARLALTEPHCLLDNDNPGRRVIEGLARLSEPAKLANRALENRARELVGRLASSDQDPRGAFERALEDIGKLAEQQARALDRNLERVIKTEEGQEKLRQARADVDRLLSARLRPPHAPQAVVDLVNSGWRDLLVLTHVKEGPGSRAWKDYVNTLDLLALWLIEQRREGDGAPVQLERELEADTFVDMVEQQLHGALPSPDETGPVFERLRDTLAGRAPLATVPVEAVAADTATDPGDRRRRLEASPRLGRWIRRVQSLETGTWFCYRDDTGARRRMKLAWINSDRDRYVFVNERGQKQIEFSDVQLARKLSRGLRTPGPEDQLSPVERGIFDTLDRAHDTLAKERPADQGPPTTATTGDEEDGADDREHWTSEIGRHLEQGRFLLRAQPIVEASREASHSQRHYEILMAVLDEDDQPGSPQDLILAAERYGFMTRIDRWVVDQTFEWVRGLMDEGREVPQLSINISGNSICDDDFMHHMMEQIDLLKLDTARLCFEITETGSIDNLVKAGDFVRAFRQIGCRFSLDDFGTGLASYNYLRELPVDFVKIDGTFVTDIHRNRNDYAMANSINELAQFLGQQTIAECVENDEIADTLREIGVDFLQGWGVGRPRPLADIKAELAG